MNNFLKLIVSIGLIITIIYGAVTGGADLYTRYLKDNVKREFIDYCTGKNCLD